MVQEAVLVSSSQPWWLTNPTTSANTGGCQSRAVSHCISLKIVLECVNFNAIPDVISTINSWCSRIDIKLLLSLDCITVCLHLLSVFSQHHVHHHGHVFVCLSVFASSAPCWCSSLSTIVEIRFSKPSLTLSFHCLDAPEDVSSSLNHLCFFLSNTPCKQNVHLSHF